MEREKFELYYQLLVEWNNKFNLTSVTERDKVELLHFKDSVLPVELIPSKAIMLDIGSGAGFPAIPLKIVRPDLDITMVDSVNKKVSFLSEVIFQLKLDGIRAVHKRIEELDKNQKYDVVTSRAVASLNILCEYCLPFVKKGGFMLAYKSSDIQDELSQAKTAIEILGGGEVKTVTMELTEEIKRTFVIIKKIKDTPKGYPRGGNKPRLKPIV
ncbi:MAG: 16S rRNA (guanine(527)-N(7))-methyltransferase RsmG [Clostridia bacterium]|nr:16S rRNA (guanine(527)-N(7))-methyltransferase RsmG [Clostridia bacterium]